MQIGSIATPAGDIRTNATALPDIRNVRSVMPASVVRLHCAWPFCRFPDFALIEVV